MAVDPAKQALSFIEEFKAFALKGNLIDLAIGFIIGTAFGKIVTSLVENIIMPIVGLIMPGKGYESMALTVGDKTIPYGKFLGAIVDFLILALVLFILFVKILGPLMKKTADAPPPPSKTEELLTQIRDQLAKR